MAAYGIEPEKSRYRPVPTKTPMTVPGQLPPTGTTLPPPPPGTVGVPPTTGRPHPGNTGKPIDQPGPFVPRPVDRGGYRGGRQGLPPNMPVGPTKQRPGTRPVGGVPLPPPPVPPVAPPALPPPTVEPPNPVLALDDPVEGSLTEQAFLPGDDKRLQGAQGATDAAMQRIADGDPYSDRAAGNESRYRKVFGEAQDGGRYLDAQDAAVKGLGGPSRTELAKQALADLEAQSDKTLQARYRGIGQKNAALGRIGSGMVTTDLSDALVESNRALAEARRGLARDVSEGDISDRFRRVDATSGLRRGESGIASGLRGENFERQRSAIDYGGRDASQDIGNEYDELSAAGQLEDRIFGQGQMNRGEFRTERGYQQGRRQQSLDDRIRQRELENAERRERAIRANMLLQAGGSVPNLEDLLRAG